MITDEQLKELAPRMNKVFDKYDEMGMDSASAMSFMFLLSLDDDQYESFMSGAAGHDENAFQLMLDFNKRCIDAGVTGLEKAEEIYKAEVGL